MVSYNNFNFISPWYYPKHFIGIIIRKINYNIDEKISSFYGGESIGAILSGFSGFCSSLKGPPQDVKLEQAHYYQGKGENGKQYIGKTKIPPRVLLFLAVLVTFIFSNFLQWWG